MQAGMKVPQIRKQLLSHAAAGTQVFRFFADLSTFGAASVCARPGMSEPLPVKIGKYPIIRELGRGATSVVYLARDPFANREVAIKVVRSQSPGDTDLRRRFRKVFLNEAALVGKLFHPHILAIYDASAIEICPTS